MLSSDEARSFSGQARRGARSIFADVEGSISSDTFSRSYSNLSNKVRTLAWCYRTLERECGELPNNENLSRLSEMGLLFFGLIEDWMGDLDEIGHLSWQRYMGEKNTGAAR